MFERERNACPHCDEMQWKIGANALVHGVLGWAMLV